MALEIKSLSRQLSQGFLSYSFLEFGIIGKGVENITRSFRLIRFSRHTKEKHRQLEATSGSITSNRRSSVKKDHEPEWMDVTDHWNNTTHSVPPNFKYESVEAPAKKPRQSVISVKEAITCPETTSETIIKKIKEFDYMHEIQEAALDHLGVMLSCQCPKKKDPNEERLILLIIKLMQCYRRCSPVQAKALSALLKVCSKTDSSKAAMLSQADNIDTVVQAMESCPHSEQLQADACLLLSILFKYDQEGFPTSDKLVGMLQTAKRRYSMLCRENVQSILSVLREHEESSSESDHEK